MGDLRDPRFPRVIRFPALKSETAVIYQPTDSNRLTLRHAPQALVLSGDVNGWPKVQRRLIAWLNEEAEREFVPLLGLHADRHGFTYQGLQIRHMKTRWGSCRKDGLITLNSQLLFLPLPLIEHVMLHELCHTRYMSHGPRFWGLLNRVDPHTPILNKALRKVEDYVPLWCQMRYTLTQTTP